MNLRESASIDRPIGALVASSAYDLARHVARTWAAPALIVCVAAFLRLYRLELQAWTPDTYEQMAAASRLIGGDFPLSRLYPPGIAVTLAPAYLIFPDTLATMQGVIVVFSLALVVLAYVWSRRMMGDERAALMAAFSVAALPLFVYFSRDGLFDIIGTAWLLSAVLGANIVRGRGWVAGLAYGLVLAVAINIRASNIAILPAVLIYGLAPTADQRPRAGMRTIVAAGAAMTALTLAGIVAGGWFGTAGGGAMTLSRYAGNVGFYLSVIMGGALYAPFIVPLALAGGRRLWTRDRAFVMAATYMVIAWPLMHAPFLFANHRYMLAPLFLMLLLSAHGASALLAGAPNSGWAPIRRTLGAPAVILFVSALLVGGAGTARHWGRNASSSDEAAFRELRPVVAGLPADSLLVGAVLRGVQGANEDITHLDLIDHSLATGNTPEKVDEITGIVETSLTAGQPVYYVYSRFEANGDDLGKGGTGYDAYFDAITREFEATVIYQTSVEKFRLYRIMP
ncbi:MAG: glycosyltransferase family 39 protein [Dehalococcoidia bacterium]